MKCVFLDTTSLDDLDLNAIASKFSAFVTYSSTTSDQVAARIEGFDVVITNKVVLSRDVILGASALKLICVVATGVNNVDLDAAKQAEVAVYNAQAYGTDAVAQHVLMLMLVMHTRFLDYQRQVKAGEWQKASQFCLLDFPILELKGRTLGLVGYGVLGQRVAQLAGAFGMKVLVAARAGSEPGEGRLALEEMLPQIDVLSLHCPLTDLTRNLIDEAAIKRLPKGSFLINAARGGIVNEEALADALIQGHLAGAATDVLTQEPPKEGNRLLDESIPNLIVTPHNAWGTREARQTIITQTAENIEAWKSASDHRRVV